MYRAKALGVARSAVFDASMHDHAVARLQMESDLRRAIERGELRVHYQPVVALQSARITGFEALARWQHPRRGLVAPGEFISLAEDTGVIGALGRWVLLEACRHVRSLQAGHPDLTLAVNVSGREILQADFVEQIRQALLQTGFPPHLLRLELTETVLLENEAAASRSLQAVREMGVKLAIDDFGTGYSSLMWLHRMPIDVLKIDASFVAGMAEDERNRRIVDAILSLGRNLGVEVIAEGVETAQQAHALSRLGCASVQGFLFSEPVEAEVAAHLLGAPSRFTPQGRKLPAN
jgi:EAL domain-containing protein (putative c-di-GMP-specific phosphodiesterase class I)